LSDGITVNDLPDACDFWSDFRPDFVGSTVTVKFLLFMSALYVTTIDTFPSGCLTI
jgi:hypothetical protein